MTLKVHSQIKLILGSALFFCGTIFFIKPTNQLFDPNLLPQPAIQHFSVGFKIQIADTLWLRALENFDYCEQKINQTECKGKAWLFQTLDLATELDPVFENGMYRMGGLALSVIISDIEGATSFFNKGVRQHPNYWPLLYAAAFHAHFEEKNKKKASDLYFRAAQNGAPEWIQVMAGRLAAEEGESEFAEKILQTMIESNQDPKYIQRLRDKISALLQNRK